MEERQDRFSIRKFTVGVASVLIGSLFFGIQTGQAVSAADSVPDNVLESGTSTSSEDESNKESVDVSNSDDQVSVNANVANTETSSEDLGSAETNADTSVAEKAQDSEKDTKSVIESVETAKTAETKNTTENSVADTVKNQNEAVQTPAVSQNSKQNVKDSSTAESAKNNSDDVTDLSKGTLSDSNNLTDIDQLNNNQVTINSLKAQIATIDAKSGINGNEIRAALLAGVNSASGATQTEIPAPTSKGYSVTDNESYAKSYNANNVPLDPNPAH